MTRILVGLCGYMLFSCSTSEPAPLTIPAIFRDHMVIQQNEDLVVWGNSLPGAEVSLKGSWGPDISINTDERGDWQGKLPAPGAGGPFMLEISTSDTTVQIEDVYAGEVWLASGQSNMEMPLRGWPPNDTINYSAREISAASYPEIRMFTVQRAIAVTEETDVTGSWKVCTPENAGDFSATAFFFARNLYETLKVPVGIIHSSWGGTPAESWVSKASLRELGDFNETLAALDVPEDEQEAYRKWKAGLPQQKYNTDELATAELADEMVDDADFDITGWKEMELPQMWEADELQGFDGIVWYARDLKLENLNDSPYKLFLGPIDDMDIAYVNGTEVGRIDTPGKYQALREYEIPAGLLSEGNNRIAVKVFDTGGGGGLYGRPEQLYLESTAGEKISLAGSWSYLPVAEYQNTTLYNFGVSDNQYSKRPDWVGELSAFAPTMLYNAMIAPIIDYPVRGVIWYQGESNVGRAEQYERLFPALISDWRRQTGKPELPFYFVQIAPYQYGGDNVASAALRDAQRKTTEMPGTGMAVSMDIGNTTNIHPGNKQDVGNRLALLALHDVYDQEVTASGPEVTNVTADGSMVLISLDHADSISLTSPAGFELAGEDGEFHPATVWVSGNSLLVQSANVNAPVAVRYLWTDTATATLFNSAGLPASSFWEKVE